MESLEGLLYYLLGKPMGFYVSRLTMPQGHGLCKASRLEKPDSGLEKPDWLIYVEVD